ncbi:hypothetical protein TRFO_21906 [Tritrichomonas foetus]|uniref:SP-RING-type domain-containing protein n=1 Tax=Tritrichomonas foetus TaxID=1144522 RepID=A0A1J4KCV4_9EUKA|nr:hypothetical protein TRFO_21906 [Tritrichomonas foetus]|eukprot:OHT09255.1 hypothetical protein TRFO_21906 [Tritrichomonas foetus]
MLPPECCPIPLDKLPLEFRNKLSSPDIYHQIEFNDLLSDPYFLGISNDSIVNIPIEPFEESAVFRFISFNFEKIEFLEWPSSFQIYICGKWMKKPKNDSSLFFFIPKGFSYLKNMTVRCSIEQTSFLLIFQTIKINPSLVYSIPNVSGNVGLPTSPISGKKMLFPARSKFCQHIQCVELDEFVSFIDREKKCPICGIYIKHESIIIDSNIHVQALTDSLIKQTKQDFSYGDFFDFFS